MGMRTRPFAPCILFYLLTYRHTREIHRHGFIDIALINTLKEDIPRNIVFAVKIEHTHCLIPINLQCLCLPPLTIGMQVVDACGAHPHTHYERRAASFED